MAYSYLPEDLIMKILLPQPVKSLLRLRCVCKHWKEIISSKSFIKSHVAYQKTYSKANKYLLLDYDGSYTTSLIDSGSYDKIVECHDVYGIFGRTSMWFKAYGICNGLVCLSIYDHWLCNSINFIMLWNPIARGGKKLPDPLDNHHYARSSLCFGYHDDDYKVIQVAPVMDSYHVYIHSLSMDNWKLLKFNQTNSTGVSPYRDARLVNGVAYFSLYSHEDLEDSRLVFFDLSCEVTGEINLPDDFQYDGDNFIMEEFRESIALIGYSLSRRQDVKMWVLRVSDNSFSWDEKFIMETEDMYCPDQLMGLIDNDKLLINSFRNYASSYRDKYTLCNVENGFRQQLTSTPKGLEKRISPRRIHDFTESLVLLDETPTPLPEMQPCEANASSTSSQINRTTSQRWSFMDGK